MTGPDDEPPHTHSAQDVRQGEIILRSRTSRVIFIAGLVGLILFALLMGWLSSA